MQVDELLEKIEEVLSEIRVIDPIIPIVVEGENDVKALRELGIKGTIIPIKPV